MRLMMAALFILTLGSAQAFAQTPVEAMLRDAQHLALCIRALDTACVIELSDVPSFRLLSSQPYDFAESQARFYTAMRDRGWVYSRFDVNAPAEVFRDGTLMYAFVPFVSTQNFGGQLHTMQGYEIALSRDGGVSWKFVETGAGMATEQVRLIVPGYAGQPLPITLVADP